MTITELINQLSIINTFQVVDDTPILIDGLGRDIDIDSIYVGQTGDDQHTVVVIEVKSK